MRAAPSPWSAVACRGSRLVECSPSVLKKSSREGASQSPQAMAAATNPTAQICRTRAFSGFERQFVPPHAPSNNRSTVFSQRGACAPRTSRRKRPRTALIARRTRPSVTPCGVLAVPNQPKIGGPHDAPRSRNGRPRPSSAPECPPSLDLWRCADHSPWARRDGLQRIGEASVQPEQAPGSGNERKISRLTGFGTSVISNSVR